MKKIPFHYRLIRGAIGKKFVVKHYKGGRIVVTRFPDMKGIVATEKQKKRRNLFKEAVGYAKWIIADKERKEAFKSSLPRKKRKKVYQAAIQLYMSRQGDKQWLSKQLAKSERHRVMSNGQLARDDRQSVDYKQQGPWKPIWEKREFSLKENLLRETSQVLETCEVSMGREISLLPN